MTAMTTSRNDSAPIRNPDCFFMGGEWSKPSRAAKLDVFDSSSEERIVSVAEALAADIERAVAAAREAFDHGPWPQLSHAERAKYLRAIGQGTGERAEDIARLSASETGLTYAIALTTARSLGDAWDYYAGLATTFPFVERHAQLACGGGHPAHLNRRYFVEPTVFGKVDNRSTIGPEEIFGPVVPVIAADSEPQAIEIANDTRYGLNNSILTNDLERPYAVARQRRSRTDGHNLMHSDFTIADGGFKQSGIGREGGTEGLHHFLEPKTIILDGLPFSVTGREG